MIRSRVHLFPSRTQKLSSILPTILAWRRAGKIGNANTGKRSGLTGPDLFLYSSLAQSVEHAAVNRGVVGSSPTGGANMRAAAGAAARVFSIRDQTLGPLAQLVRADGS